MTKNKKAYGFYTAGPVFFYILMLFLVIPVFYRFATPPTVIKNRLRCSKAGS